MNFKKPKFWDSKKISIWVIILFPLSIIYQFIYWTINLLRPLRKFPIPIICIGNIYLGGTGKTPLTREIFNICKSLNKNPAFIKKPYAYLIDEIKMLEKTGKIFTSKDRIKSINLSINHKYDVGILDDGFQDFSIKPDLSILCFNSKQLIGNGFVIPSGPLRESFSSIKRANCILINGDKNSEFEKKIKEANTHVKIFYCSYKIKNPEKFKKNEVIAFAGIGNPQNFFDLLKKDNINLKKTFSFSDHYNYSDNDFDKIITSEENLMYLTTEKDYFRLNNKMKKQIDCVEVDLIIENKDEFKNFIKNYL
tara:strand:+ start:1504 stop:2427 length:924 start_codon:yes stop_codon:yes gene_type:complete